MANIKIGWKLEIEEILKKKEIFEIKDAEIWEIFLEAGEYWRTFWDKKKILEIMGILETDEYRQYGEFRKKGMFYCGNTNDRVNIREYR